MHPAHWFASVLAIAVGVGLVAGPRATAADRPIVPDLELEALKEAVSWPRADVAAVMTLAGRLMAGRRSCPAIERPCSGCPYHLRRKTYRFPFLLSFPLCRTPFCARSPNNIANGKRSV